MKTAIRLSAVFFALVLIFPAPCSLAETMQETVRLINHRGYNTAAPENTIPAFELSGKMGYTWVETDVSFTKDLVPVILHDPEINRTARLADGSKLKKKVRICDITYEEALAYDFGIWQGEAFRETKIPTFESFLQLCRVLGFHPYIELKQNGVARREQISGLVDLVRKYGLQERVTWISFHREFLEWVRDDDPGARLGYLVLLWFTENQFAEILRQATELKTESNEVFLDVNIYTLLITQGTNDQYIQMCRDAGFPLEVWTLDSEDILENLDPYITGVTSNSLRP